MLYAFVCEDVPGGAGKRAGARAAHLARLDRLQDEGRMVLAGAMPAIDAEDPGPAGCFGSLIVADFDSLEDAEAWLAADPYAAGGVFARTTVRPFKRAFPR